METATMQDQLDLAEDRLRMHLRLMDYAFGENWRMRTDSVPVESLDELVKLRRDVERLNAVIVEG